MLDRTGYSPEEQRRRFQELVLATGDCPFAYAQRLNDLARWWLHPEIRSATGVVEQVVLERFLGGLPTATAAWVRCHRSRGRRNLGRGSPRPAPRPHAGGEAGAGASKEASPSFGARCFSPGARATSTWRFTPFPPPPPVPGSVTVRPDPQGKPQTPGPECWRCGQLGHFRHECPLMEVGQVVQVVGPPTSAHDSEGAFCIPVRVQGSEHRALLDSGAMQSLIRQSLVRPEALVMTPWVTIRCVHGDEHSCLIVSVEINLQGQTHIIKAAVSTRLSHPLILGTDWPGFRQVVKDLMGV